MRKKINLCSGWRFSDVFEERYIDSEMTEADEVTLPHSVCETPLHYFDEIDYQKLSTYQKNLFAPDEWQDKRIVLTFDGAAHRAEVYLNGRVIKSHDCGYTAFSVELTDKLNINEDNLITVKLDSRETLDQPPFGFVIDYMTYGGLYRDVYLEITEKSAFTDVFFKPEVNNISETSENGNGKLSVQFSITDSADRDLFNNELSVRVGMTPYFTDATDNVEKTVDQKTVDQKIIEQKLSYEMLQKGELDRSIMDNKLPDYLEVSGQVSDIRLWSPEKPSLYTVSIELIGNGEIIDTYTSTIGFRQAEFRADGFYLNGQKYKIRGMNRHQSFPYVGYAMPESMQRYDAEILKNEIGVNAVRTSHYPQSHYFIDECDKIGLLVFTEIPGWQHIGSKKWQDQAVYNVYDMVTQYRNHTSIILWGVRINESEDNDGFYSRTNRLCHLIDPTRQTGGVRCRTADKNTNIQEDVFTYNDFVHSGQNQGCLKKEKSTNDMNKGYLVSEYNGHMYPTKKYDSEEHRLAHTLRHANVLNAVAEESDIAGSFAWCMFDYNTHKDFGSGDRICYHGVCDMFRNLKSAAYVYGAEGLIKPVLEVTSTMDIGEHPACNRGDVYIISNADSVRMYKSDKLLKEYFPKDSKYKGLKHGPILIDDFIGDGLVEEEHMSMEQATITKDLLNKYSINKGKMTVGMIWDALRLILRFHMSMSEAIPLYQKYIGNWGGESIEYRFDALTNNEVVRSKIEAPMRSVHMGIKTSATILYVGETYDVAEIRVFACDENENVLPFYNDPLIIHTEGPISIIGPEVISFDGGMTGIYVRTTGEEGDCSVILQSQNMPPIVKKQKKEKRIV